MTACGKYGCVRTKGRLLARPTKVNGAAPVGLQPLMLGATRDSYLYVPTGYRAERPAPLALLLHGAGGLASRLGTFGEVLYAVSPKSVDIVMNTAYNLFPDSKAAKGDGAGPAPAEEKKKDEEMSAEAVAMAYLLRGVHF